MNGRTVVRLAILVFLVGAFVASVDAAGYKSVIQVQKKAKADGHIEFSLTPAGSDEAQTIEITVLAKSKPPEIARDIYKELAVALGDRFQVKQSGSATVTVKTVDRSDFKLVLSGQSVEGLSIVIK